MASVRQLANILRNNADTIDGLGIAIEESGTDAVAEELATHLLAMLSAEGLEILPHQHEWVQEVVVTYPPKEIRRCKSCGRVEKYSPGEWVVLS